MFGFMKMFNERPSLLSRLGRKAPNSIADSSTPPSASASVVPEATHPTNSEAGESQRSLENFRAVFGYEQGSVYFADGVDFEPACLVHIGSLNSIIANQKAELEQLSQQCRERALEIAGEEEPVELLCEGDPGTQGPTAAERFAAGLEIPQ